MIARIPAIKTHKRIMPPVEFVWYNSSISSTDCSPMTTLTVFEPFATNNVTGIPLTGSRLCVLPKVHMLYFSQSLKNHYKPEIVHKIKIHKTGKQ